MNPHPVPVRVAVIGGSGVYKLDCLQNSKLYEMDTPFGRPSGAVCVAEVPLSDGRTAPCAFLPRHGHGHSLNPSEVNYRANICALKMLGVEYVVAINAVGSLSEDYKPGDLAVVSNLIDKTFKRDNTFFERGAVAHVGLSHPTSPALNALVHETLTQKVFAGDGSFTVHAGGVAVTMEGPQFSTQAESVWHRTSLGAQLIGMTSATEARLAREAEMAYCIIAMVTDYDAWKEDAAEHVDASAVMQVMAANVAKAQRFPPPVIAAIYERLVLPDGAPRDPAHDALRFAIMTKPEGMSEETKRRLAPLLAQKYPQFAPSS